LHGHRVTLDRLSSFIIFSSLSKSRGRDTLINYAKIVGSKVIRIDEKTFGIPQEFGWLAQLL
jgi:hypothetical protein